jgi:plastocyanin
VRSILALGALLLIGLAGCGSSGSSMSTSTSSASSSAASSGKIQISGFEFAPRTVTVKAGTPIVWTNEDSAAHTATASGPNGGFDTGTLQKGDSKTVKVKPGTYHYVCGIHPFMKATLIVK